MASAWLNSISSAVLRVPASLSCARLRASSARSTEISSACSATSASTVTRSGSTSRKPPPTKISSSAPPITSWMRSGPGFRTVIRGAWRAMTPSSPSAPLAMMNSTSPSKRLRSTLTTRSGYFISGCGGLLHLLSLLAGLLDRAHHVESLLRQIVVLSLEDLREAAHRVGDLHVLALASRETLRDAERLREESLDLASARNRLLVVFRQLLHAQDGDDVLQVFVALHRLLDALCGVVMLLADDRRLDETAGRAERVDGGIDPDLDQGPLQTNGGAQVGEHCLDGGVRVVVRGHIHGLHRCDRSLAGRCDALLQLAHLGRERGLVTDS